MVPKETYLANSKIIDEDKNVEGTLVNLEGERFFKVENYDRMPPFLMNIVSDTDHWMFISSSGGVTAGRKNADQAIFPYYTDDKIHESAGTAGSKTILRVEKEKRILVWEPFSEGCRGSYRLSRNLYKSTIGNQLVFEEINHDLELCMRVKWMNSDAFGWIRQTTITNLSGEARQLSMLDGIQNILPYGILKNVQEQFSTLMDAYKRSELDQKSGLGIFSMASIPVDRAEPSEALRATTAWSTATSHRAILLSNDQMERYRITGMADSETDIKGKRGAYFLVRDLQLKPGAENSSMIVMEVACDSASVADLSAYVSANKNKETELLESVQEGSRNLYQMVSKADGLQECGDERIAIRHFSNVLFNIMRGGIYDREYTILKEDIAVHLRKFNRTLATKHAQWLESLNATLDYTTLINKAESTGDHDLQRIILAYLPLSFSRRHGDPSRPWNRFSIDIKNSDGSRSLSYEGNWRDIFQNWEALSYSYPLFLQGIISRFLNATTVDGYNPYRITSSGIDWETFDPEDPWSFIGYWGDHQIIYLVKLLELHEQFFPGKLDELMDLPLFAFANVPYRIKSYEQILKDPNRTIEFEEALHKSLLQKAAEIGADGKLLTDKDGQLVRATLPDKLLITLLTKLSNFVPGAGIWLNTQRPEWNDANNALVGNGVSMVTLYYLRRYITFLEDFLAEKAGQEVPIAAETAMFLASVDECLRDFRHLLEKPFSDSDRKMITDRLGAAGSYYRQQVYKRQVVSHVKMSISDITGFLEHALAFIDHTIRMNRREDQLYHAYNLIDFSDRGIEITRLPVMLEGQVAFLSAGYAGAEEVLTILDAMRASDLYREDQQSYMLYPERQLPGFTEKNNIPASATEKYPVLQILKEKQIEDIIRQDASGVLHFNGDLKNAGVLQERLDALQEKGKLDLDEHKSEQLFKLYEKLFDHHSFTGRSGSFFKYEGLGSIYWHMVSKLLLAVGENIQHFKAHNTAPAIIMELLQHYNQIREGIGVHKNPMDYGAIPTDPYSHTPAMMGAQQPGMTGQVKEDIISRWFELGLSFRNGAIHIDQTLLNRKELDAKGELSFTFCGTPFRYTSAGAAGILLKMSDGKEERLSANQLEAAQSSKIFSRSGEISEVVIMYQSKV